MFQITLAFSYLKKVSSIFTTSTIHTSQALSEELCLLCECNPYVGHIVIRGCSPRLKQH